MEYKSVLKKVSGGEGDRCHYPTRLDVYGCGCEHNCTYCYARSLLEFRGLWEPVEPRIATKTCIAKALDKISPQTVIRLGGMTDPFQPVESREHLNRWLIGELNKRGIGYLIVTKSPTVSDCLDVLDRNLAHVQISVTSTTPEIPYKMENAEPFAKRLQSAIKLQSAGIDVQLRLSPFIPQLVDLNLIRDCPIEKIVVEFLRVNSRICKNMPWLDISEYTERCGAYRTLPLDSKMDYIRPLLGKKRVTVCEDNPQHYDFFNRYVNPNPEDCCDLRNQNGTI